VVELEELDADGELGDGKTPTLQMRVCHKEFGVGTLIGWRQLRGGNLRIGDTSGGLASNGCARVQFDGPKGLRTLMLSELTESTLHGALKLPRAVEADWQANPGEMVKRRRLEEAPTKIKVDAKQAMEEDRQQQLKREFLQRFSLQVLQEPEDDAPEERSIHASGRHEESIKKVTMRKRTWVARRCLSRRKMRRTMRSRRTLMGLFRRVD
jgi:hypothetical protein